MDLDNILRELGQFGKYQIYIYILLFFPMAFSTIGSITYIFTTGDVEYRCLIPECEGNISHTFDEPWLEWAIPNWQERNSDVCLRFKPRRIYSLENCSKEAFTEETQECSRFVFKNDEKTIVNEFNLECRENNWKRTIIGTLNTIGQFIGLPIAGVISDRYGRKTLIIGSVLLSSLFGTLRSISTSYDQFLMFEMLDSLAYSGVYAAVYIFGIEIIGPERRGIGGVILSCFSSIGGTILGIIVWWVPDWRIYLRIIYLPGFLFVSYIWIFPESLRWSMAHGKSKAALETLSQISLTNRRPLSEEMKIFIRKMSAVQYIVGSKDVKFNPEVDDRQKKPLKAVISSKTMVFRVLNCSFCWVTHTFVYYGLSLVSVLISGDKYLNYILSSLIEIPGYCMSWVLVDRIGRKSGLILGLIISGITCTSFHFISKDDLVIRLVLFLTGKLAISFSFATLYVISSEFYPTNLRNTLIGISSTVGRIGSMAAPQTSLIAEIVDPFLVFGSISLLAGGLSFFFPETLNCKLPETVEEAENLGKINTVNNRKHSGKRRLENSTEEN